MNEESMQMIFITIAHMAMNSGYEMKLEKDVNHSRSSVLGGSFSSSNMDFDSLSLIVYHPEQTPEENEPEEYETDAAEDCLKRPFERKEQ